MTLSSTKKSHFFAGFPHSENRVALDTENVPRKNMSPQPLGFLLLTRAGGIPLLKHRCRCGRRFLQNWVRLSKPFPRPWASWISWKTLEYCHLPALHMGLAVEGKHWGYSQILRCAPGTHSRGTTWNMLGTWMIRPYPRPTGIRNVCFNKPSVMQPKIWELQL